MKSRERVMAAFGFQEGDRVPMWHGLSNRFIAKACGELGLPDEEALRQRLGDDFRRVFARYDLPDDAPLPEGVVSRTIFGVDRLGYGYGQPASHPLADATLQGRPRLPLARPAWMDVSGIRARPPAAWRDEYAILGGDWSPFWHDLIDLLGMETMYLKMYDEPELVDALLGHMVDYYAAVSRRIFDAAADADRRLLHRQRLRQPDRPAAEPGAMFRPLHAAAPRHA